MKKNIIFLNGKFVDEKEAVVSIKTHALHYGTACFEGIRAYYNKDTDSLFVFRIKDHYRRFLNSAKLLFIKIPYSEKELRDLTIGLLKKNFEETDIYIRPLAYKSDSVVGNFVLTKLSDGLAIYAVPLGRYLNTDAGIKVNVSSWRRVPDSSIPPRGKITGSYINTSLAKTESFLNGFDEALLLDNQGHIVEGSAENLFLIKDGIAITPPESDDILVGITRDTIIKLLGKFSIKVVERSIDRSEIYSADEVFLVGTGAEVTPVVEIDRRTVGNGEVGEISSQVKKAYLELVHGKSPDYPEFLTEIKK